MNREKNEKREIGKRLSRFFAISVAVSKKSQPQKLYRYFRGGERLTSFQYRWAGAATIIWLLLLQQRGERERQP